MTSSSAIRVLSVAATLLVIAAAQGRRVDGDPPPCPQPPVTCGVLEAKSSCTQGFSCRCIAGRCQPIINDLEAFNGAHFDPGLQNFVLTHVLKDCFTTQTCKSNAPDPLFCDPDNACTPTGNVSIPEQTCQYEFSTSPPTPCTPQ